MALKKRDSPNESGNVDTYAIMCWNTYKEEHDGHRCNVDRDSSPPEWYIWLVDLSCDKDMYQQPWLQSTIPFGVFNFVLASLRIVPGHLFTPIINLPG